MRPFSLDDAQRRLLAELMSCTCVACRGECDEGPLRCKCPCACSAAGRIEAAVRLLDALDVPSTASLLGAALWYAENGLHVFPLMPLSKQPWPRSHGCKDATTDSDLVRRWWGAAPTSNIGIATGHVVDVIDIDGLDGNKAFARLFDDESDDVDQVDRIFRQSTGSTIGQVSTPRAGGRHLYVRTKARGNNASLKPHVDYRGLGGYVVAPPSRTEVGTYRWTQPLTLPHENGTQNVRRL